MTMLVTDAPFKDIFEGRSSYISFMHDASKAMLNETARKVTAIVTTATCTPDDVHYATIVKEKEKHRLAQWSNKSKKHKVLFASTGIYVYAPTASMQGRNRIRGGTDVNILDTLGDQNEIAHIEWDEAHDDAEPVPVILLQIEVAKLKHQLAAVKAKLTIENKKNADAQRIIARLISPAVRTNLHTPVTHNAGKSFTTFMRKNQGIDYEYSNDFRPDVAPAHEWKGNEHLLFGYMNTNRYDPECIFPHIIEFTGRDQREALNCDYDVIFEHPVTKEKVPVMKMKKAFRSLHRDYNYLAHIFETDPKNNFNLE